MEEIKDQAEAVVIEPGDVAEAPAELLAPAAVVDEPVAAAEEPERDPAPDEVEPPRRKRVETDAEAREAIAAAIARSRNDGRGVLSSDYAAADCVIADLKA
jgi:hypothetical protein